MTECFKNHPEADKENHYCRMQGYNTTLKCDGKWDCRDGQDEHNCPLFSTQAFHPGMNFRSVCFILDGFKHYVTDRELVTILIKFCFEQLK